MIDIAALEKVIEEFVQELDAEDCPEYPGVSVRDEGESWMGRFLDFVKEYEQK